jgi:hypothetical protein
MTSTETGMLGQVERIARSEAFRNAEGLKRLLTYLAERTAAGEAAQLKEYTVGVDGLSKPVTYDPRHDAAVRIQVGRLRQKLTDYYLNEGKEDRIIIELPKGQFGLVCEIRDPVHAEKSTRWRMAVAGLAIAFLAALGWGIYEWTQVKTRVAAREDWTPELQQIWQRFTASDRPVVVILADPLFVQFKGYGAYRSQILNTWEEALGSPAVKEIRKALKGPAIERNSRYTGVSEANAAFLLGRFLSPRVIHLSLQRSSELSWPQLANNNIIYVGAERIITQELQSLPLKLAFSYDYEGIINFHPQPGEPALFDDPPGVKAADASEDGMAYALVSCIPGPAGHGEMMTFTSNSPSARLAAVQAFTTPADARELFQHLRGEASSLPLYYQVILRIKYKAGVPTETAFIRSRALQADAN